MNSFPLIGISGSIDTEEVKHVLVRSYMQAILAAGGIPLMLSPDMNDAALDACLTRLDGLLLAGGNDIAPRIFGHTPIEALGEVNPLRDQFELRLIARVVARKLPVLGICRGIQVMNAALGGALYQDLPTQFIGVDGKLAMKHQQSCGGQYASHSVNVAQGTLLHEIIGLAQFDVNSFHHQAVWTLAPKMRASATAEDGVLEAIEPIDLANLPFFIGVQWHPERMYADNPQAAALFSALVKAADLYAKERDA